jgi:hypothetical protein
LGWVCYVLIRYSIITTIIITIHHSPFTILFILRREQTESPSLVRSTAEGFEIFHLGGRKAKGCLAGGNTWSQYKGP